MGSQKANEPHPPRGSPFVLRQVPTVALSFRLVSRGCHVEVEVGISVCTTHWMFWLHYGAHPVSPVSCDYAAPIWPPSAFWILPYLRPCCLFVSNNNNAFKCYFITVQSPFIIIQTSKTVHNLKSTIRTMTKALSIMQYSV